MKVCVKAQIRLQSLRATAVSLVPEAPLSTHRLYQHYPDCVCFKGGEKSGALPLSSSGVLQTLASSPGFQRSSSDDGAGFLQVLGRKPLLFPKCGGCVSPTGAASSQSTLGDSCCEEHLSPLPSQLGGQVFTKY